jgi:hypothetical protein
MEIFSSPYVKNVRVFFESKHVNSPPLPFKGLKKDRIIGELSKSVRVKSTSPENSITGAFYYSIILSKHRKKYEKFFYV